MTDNTNKGGSESIEGIAGWLLIPAIGLILLPIRNLSIILFGIMTSFNRLPPERTSDPRTWIIGAMELMMIVALATIALFFFKKRRITVPAIIVLMAAYIPFELIQVLIKSFQYSQITVYMFRGLVEALVISGIFIPYFMKSHRVKNTFIN